MHPDARCIDCGYLLRGLNQSRCPECGRAFSPDDAATINPGQPYGPWVRWMLRPTHWIATASYYIAAGLLVVQAMLLLDRLFTFSICAIIYVIVASPYAIRGSMRYAVIWWYRQPKKMRRADDRVLRRMHVAFLIAGFLALSGLVRDIPFNVCAIWIWPIANHEFNDMPLDAPLPGPRWIGPYRVTIAERGINSISVETGFRFLRFVYPDPRPPRHVHPYWTLNYETPMPWDWPDPVSP
jgi:hypothetical protein